MISSTVTPKIDIKLEKNSKGFNYEIKLNQADATTPAQIDAAIKLIQHAETEMKGIYGAPVVNGGER